MNPRGCGLALLISLAMWAALILAAVTAWRPARAEAPPASAILLPPAEQTWITPADVEAAINGGESMAAEITAYVCHPERPCVTFSGTPARWGVVATDPAVIHLGSVVRIPGLGEFVAEDTGSAVKGAVVDVFFGDGPAARAAALAWGRRRMEIEVVRP